MKKLAARDFEDLLQVWTPFTLVFMLIHLKFQNMIPAVEGLLPEPYNHKLITLLFRLAEWHALAKLRMHIEPTLNHLDDATTAVGNELRSFSKWTLDFNTIELPKETRTRQRRQCRKAGKWASKVAPNTPVVAQISSPQTSLSGADLQTQTQTLPSDTTPNSLQPVGEAQHLNTPQTTSSPPQPKVKRFNLLTYKIHSLGDYVSMIRKFGTTDSYSTQIVSSAIIYILL